MTPFRLMVGVTRNDGVTDAYVQRAETLAQWCTACVTS